MAALLASGIALAATSAMAAPWRTIGEREAEIAFNIDAGVRTGALNQAEAHQLRVEFSYIATLEQSYRRSGGELDDAERADLDHRLYDLSQRVTRYNHNLAIGAWRSIGDRQADIFARIQQGLRDGALSAQEADRLRVEFADIAALEQYYRSTGGGLDNIERADLNRRLEDLSRRVYALKHNDVVAGWRSVDDRRAEIWSRIEQGVRNGALSRGEADQLRAEFGYIASLEQSYRQSSGGLTDAERADLDLRLQDLSVRVFNYKHNTVVAGWRSVEDRRAEIWSRIEQGVRNGALSRGEADQLRAEFGYIASLEQSYRQSSGGLNDAERADLDLRLRDLSARVFNYKHNTVVAGWRSVGDQQAGIYARIEQGTRDGSLTAGEAARLRGEFDYIAALERYYRSTGGGLTDPERADLSVRLNALSRQVFVGRHN